MTDVREYAAEVLEEFRALSGVSKERLDVRPAGAGFAVVVRHPRPDEADPQSEMACVIFSDASACSETTRRAAEDFLGWIEGEGDLGELLERDGVDE